MKTTGESKYSNLRLTIGAEAPRHRHGKGFRSSHKSEQGRRRRRRLSNTVAESPRGDSARGYLERRYIGNAQQAFLLVLPAYWRKGTSRGTSGPD